MVNNNSWLINELSTYFENLPVEIKKFTDNIYVDRQYPNLLPNKSVPTPKVLVSEIRNIPNGYTNTSERSSGIGVQILICASVMNIDNEVYDGYDACNHIAVLIDNLLGGTMRMRRVGNSNPVPSGEDNMNIFYKPLRYNYTYDLETNKIYRN